MTKKPKMVTITEAEYESLLEDQAWLAVLGEPKKLGSTTRRPMTKPATSAGSASTVPSKGRA